MQFIISKKKREKVIKETSYEIVKGYPLVRFIIYNSETYDQVGNRFI